MMRLDKLTAREWLRLLWEYPGLVNAPHLSSCKTCKVTSVGNVDLTTCTECGGTLLGLDQRFWKQVSTRLRRASQRDHSLFATVKAEFPDRPFRQLDEPLAWITGEWTRTPNPRGRPPEWRVRFFIAEWLNKLSAPRFDIVTQEHASIARFATRPPLMSRERALSVLFDEEPAQNTPHNQRRRSENLSIEELRELGRMFRKSCLTHFGKVPTRNDREIQRIIRWVHTFRQKPAVRLRGITPRQRTSKKNQRYGGSQGHV